MNARILDDLDLALRLLGIAALVLAPAAFIALGVRLGGW